MNKTGYQLRKHKPSAARAETQRPLLTLGARPRRYTATCIICDQEMLVHRSDRKTCGVKCRVAWHRLTPTEQAELLANRSMCDELASAS